MVMKNGLTTPNCGMRVLNGVRTATYTLALALLPIVALAQQKDEDKPVPLDPATAAAQNRILGIIALLIVLPIGWYYFRRWQIIRAASRPDDKKD